MNIDVGGRKIQVFVSHHRPFDRKKKPAAPVPEGCDGYTEVAIRDGKSVDTFEGRAFCLKPDNFSKETGLRIALTRALRDSNLTKGERAAIWNKLWNGKFDKRGTTSSKTPGSAAQPTASPAESSPTTPTGESIRI